MDEDTQQTPDPSAHPDRTGAQSASPPPAPARAGWRHRVLGIRGVAAVALASLVIGGAGGVVLERLSDDNGGHGTGGRRGPGNFQPGNFQPGNFQPGGQPGFPGGQNGGPPDGSQGGVPGQDAPQGGTDQDPDSGSDSGSDSSSGQQS